MTEYTYSITVQIEAGEAVDCWCEHDGKVIGYPLGALNPFIHKACQDWRERRQDALEHAADMKLELKREIAK